MKLCAHVHARRAASGADDGYRPRIGAPVGLLLQDVAREAVNVVVRAR